MNQRANAFLEIGRVVGVDPRRYTVDVITESGRMLKNIPFLSMYSKGNHNGQGVYMIPEIDSYALIMKTVSLNPNNLFGLETYCYGFFNPIDNKGSFSGGREDVGPGDYVIKTSGHNKIILTTDGVIWIYSSDLSQIRLFPASGNVRDSAGLDHLLQILVENYEFRTSGGSWEWRVNKKEEASNFRYEFRNRPLLTHNPDFMVGHIGSQGVSGDPNYFHTFERYHWVDEEQRRIIRVRSMEKTDGETELHRFNLDNKQVFFFKETNLGSRERKTLNPATDQPYTAWDEDHLGNKRRRVYDGDGTIQHELEIKATGEVKEHHYKSGSLVWTFERDGDGGTQRTHYQGGTPTWRETIDPSGHTQVFIPASGDKAKIIITPEGILTAEVDQDITIKSKSGIINLESEAKEIILKAATKVILESPLVELASPEILGQVVLHLAALLYNEHTHDFINGQAGSIGTTSVPNQQMVAGTHWSEKVSSG